MADNPTNNCVHLNPHYMGGYCKKIGMVCPNKPHACEWYKSGGECKKTTCSSCALIYKCGDAYSKPLEHHKYDKAAYSKAVGWGTMEPLLIPTRENLDKLIRECRKGSQEKAKELMRLYRHCASPTNDEEASIIAMMYQAFHELFR